MGEYFNPTYADCHPDAATGQCSKVDPAGSFCAECLSLMVEDNGAGHLCPVCDAHGDCEAFPCSGFDGTSCVLNEPLGSRFRPAATSEGSES